MERVKVLLVDDEVDFAASLAKRLGKRGCDVLVAHDGPTALRVLAAHEVDVVVLDVRMPDMDGVKLLKKIRMMHAGPEVIMLSGHIIPDAIISSMAMGAFDYLTKPFPVDKLAPRLRAASRYRAALLGGGKEA